MDQPFVGRQSELTFLQARAEIARGDTSQVVLVVGAAGIGKTALLDQFVSSTPYRVVRASGDSLELDLAYGVLEQLAGGTAEPLPKRLTVLGTHDAASTHPIHVGAGLVDLLGGSQAEGPVVLVIDDAHWADRQSLQALAFALRRLRANRVLTLLAVRDNLVERLPASLHRLIAGPTGARLRLDGLEVAELRALSQALGAGSLSKRAADRLRDHTGGNPLHARALLEELPVAALHNYGLPLPAPRSFRKLVLARLAACSTDAEQLVVAAAVLGPCSPLTFASRLAEVDDPLPALEQAIHAHLLEERPTPTELLIAFPHPLVHAAVYHDLGPARRAGLHARAAQLLAGEPAAIRHRVAAASGPDPGLAAELTALAGQQALAGAWTTAADSLLTAARLSATRVEREPLVLRAVDHLLLGGNTIEAAAFAEQVASFRDSTHRDYVAARLAMATGRRADAAPLLARAWQRNDVDLQPDLSAAIAEQLSLQGLLHADGGEALTWAQRALAAAPPRPLIPSNLQDALTVGLVIAGHAPEALKLTASLPDPAEAPSLAGLDGWIGRSIARTGTDDLPGARADLTAALTAYRSQRTPRPWALLGLAFLAEIEYRLGAWDDAITHAQHAIALAEEASEDQGGDWLAALAHAVAAFPLAARGAHDIAATHVRAAAAHTKLAGSEYSTIWVATAQALVALAEGDSQRVADAFAPLWRLPAWTAADETGGQFRPVMHAEALVALGRCGQAQAIVDSFETHAMARGRRSAQAAAARARGTLEAALGHYERAETAYQTGLNLVGDLPLPLERALLEAAYARFLRHTGRRTEAAAQLQAARGRLVALQAQPYLQRCDHDLAACAHLPTRRQPQRRPTLTPQEQAVARLVAAGRSNRQAAAELFVSVKTIEYHLSNAFAKLAVTSRTQLALALHQDSGNP